MLDTNRLTDLLRFDAGMVSIVEQAESVLVPYVVVAEMKAGFLGGTVSRQSRNEAALLRVLSKPGVEVVYADRETIEIYARLFIQLKRAGTPIPTNDLWIASLVMQHQATLYTRDRHFGKIPQVPLG